MPSVCFYFQYSQRSTRDSHEVRHEKRYEIIRCIRVVVIVLWLGSPCATVRILTNGSFWASLCLGSVFSNQYSEFGLLALLLSVNGVTIQEPEEGIPLVEMETQIDISETLGETDVTPQP